MEKASFFSELCYFMLRIAFKAFFFFIKSLEQFPPGLATLSDILFFLKLERDLNVYSAVLSDFGGMKSIRGTDFATQLQYDGSDCISCGAVIVVLSTLYLFKVAFSTFQFKFGATRRRQAERSDSEARHKAPNLT